VPKNQQLITAKMASTLQDTNIIEILKEGDCVGRCTYLGDTESPAGECVHPFVARQMRLLYRFMKKVISTDHGTFLYSVWDIPCGVLLTVADQIHDNDLAILASAAYGALVRYRVPSDYTNDVESGAMFLELIFRQYMRRYEEVQDHLNLREEHMDICGCDS
jgi:hypothetical protein